jgi:hypothetical protein
VGLVDHEQRRLGHGELVEHVGVGQLLGREEQELKRVLGEVGDRLLALGARDGRVELGRAQVPPVRVRRSSTWSRCSAMSGLTTTVAPGVSNPAI